MEKFLQKILLFFSFSILLYSCEEQIKKEIKESDNKEHWVKMLVEIPAGTIKKFELNKKNATIEMDSVDGQPRLIEYLGYPANYGMIPQTILPAELGGDGDPLDILAIGPAAQSGELIHCKIIGVLKLLDRDEQDDKLIAISKNSTLKNIHTLEDLRLKYPGILEIIETWFQNYKGMNKIESLGFDSKGIATELYFEAQKQYNLQNQ